MDGLLRVGLDLQTNLVVIACAAAVPEADVRRCSVRATAHPFSSWARRIKGGVDCCVMDASFVFPGTAQRRAQPMRRLMPAPTTLELRASMQQ
jgi:hypothetical protein